MQAICRDKACADDAVPTFLVPRPGNADFISHQDNASTCNQLRRIMIYFWKQTHATFNLLLYYTNSLLFRGSLLRGPPGLYGKVILGVIPSYAIFNMQSSSPRAKCKLSQVLFAYT